MWRRRPDLFAEQVFGVRLADHQRAILLALARGDRVSVRSGHKVGKSFLLAIAVWWWCLTRNNAKAIVFAPTHAQVQGTDYESILVMHKKAEDRGWCLPCHPPSKEGGRGITFFNGNRIICQSTEGTRPETKAGYSGQILYALEEASGIPDSVWTVCSNNPRTKIFAISNPTRTAGRFYDTHHTLSGLWNAIHVDCEDVAKQNRLLPNGQYLWPDLASPKDIANRKAEFEHSPWDYEIRVKGNFPTLAQGGVISATTVTEAQSRWTPQPSEEDACQPLRIGVDCAFQGEADVTAIVVRRGKWASSPITLPTGTDEHDAAIAVAEVLFRYLRPGEPKASINIDITSHGGLATELRRHHPEVMKVADVQGLNFASDPLNDSAGIQCGTLRDRLWIDMSTWLKTGAIPPGDRKLAEELVEPKLGFNDKGRLKVEYKREVKKRLKRSPDCADALALACFEPPTVEPARARVGHRRSNR